MPFMYHSICHGQDISSPSRKGGCTNFLSCSNCEECTHNLIIRVTREWGALFAMRVAGANRCPMVNALICEQYLPDHLETLQERRPFVVTRTCLLASSKLLVLQCVYPALPTLPVRLNGFGRSKNDSTSNDSIRQLQPRIELRNFSRNCFMVVEWKRILGSNWHTILLTNHDILSVGTFTHLIIGRVLKKFGKNSPTLIAYPLERVCEF